jgi:hypothetical protein
MNSRHPEVKNLLTIFERRETEMKRKGKKKKTSLGSLVLDVINFNKTGI